MSEMDDRKGLFDRWANHYDADLRASGEYPFGGYDWVLEMIVHMAGVYPAMQVLDLGTGTGNLARRFADLGCAVWATDFSAEMLAAARKKVPEAIFVQTDLRSHWPADLPERFDHIVSAYVFHEFPPAVKMTMVKTLAAHLRPGGRVVIGDVSFKTAAAREEAAKTWAAQWDANEYYWAADEALAAARTAGLQGEYRQVSTCGGVYVFTPKE